MSIESPSSPTEQSTLRANAIGLPGVLFQSITTMAPASAVSFSLGAAIPFAGGALPLAVFIGLIICILIALSIGSLAKYLPSVGGYFTYVSRGLGPQARWMTGWFFSLTYLRPVCASPSISSESGRSNTYRLAYTWPDHRCAPKPACSRGPGTEQ